MNFFSLGIRLQKTSQLVLLIFVMLVASAGLLHSKARVLTVITSVPPHSYIVEQLAGDKVKAVSLVDQSSDPHTYEPTPKQILTISQASVYFTTGLEFERGLLAKISSINKDLEIVPLSPANKLSLGHGDQHSWLSPDHFSLQVDSVYNTLMKYMPEQKKALTIQYDYFKGQLSKTTLQVAAQLAAYKGRIFYVFHPAFDYFGKAHGLLQNAVEVDRKSPTPKQLQAIIKRSQRDKVKIIFTQPQFDQRSAQVIAAAIGGKIKIIDPLKKNVLENYLNIADSFTESFSSNKH